MKSSRYKGVLASPIIMREQNSSRSALYTANTSPEKVAFEKLPALFAYFGLPYSEEEFLACPKDVCMLIFMLAEKHVRGFQVIAEHKKRGRPKSIDSDRMNKLVHDIQQKKKQAHCGLSDACRFLTRKGEEYQKEKASSLETRYYEAIKEIKVSKERERRKLSDFLSMAFPPSRKVTEERSAVLKRLMDDNP
ncbi:MAG: hypothetical protein AB7S81_07545 [Bdellovibrionales bacterium]